MDRNILILGAARTGKTSLAKKISKELGYSLLRIDDLVSGFEAYPDLKIRHDYNDKETAHNLTPFLEKMLIELSEGECFYDGIKYVIEGTHIDFDELMPFLEEHEDKYKVIGLTYNYITEEDLYNNIKKYDTEDDWTYWCSDEELKGNVPYFIERNKFFNEEFEKYNIKSYDTSYDREGTFKRIIGDLK